MARLYNESDKVGKAELELSSEFSNYINSYVDSKLNDGIDIQDLELCMLTTINMLFVEKRLLRKVPLMKRIKNQILNCKSEYDLRSLCSSLLRQGISNKQLLDCFEELRKHNTNMSQDDVWLNVMDSLDGWCSIHYKIK